MVDAKPLPETNRIWQGLTEFGPPMRQAVADTELTLSALPATVGGQVLLEYGIILFRTFLIFAIMEFHCI